MLKRNIKKVSDETEKARQLKLKKAWGELPKILAKEERLKIYRDRTEKYRQNGTLQNNEKILTTSMGEWAKPYQQLYAREARRFWSKIAERKDHNKKAE